MTRTRTETKILDNVFQHRTIIRTGITCKKISCYMVAYLLYGG